MIEWLPIDCAPKDRQVLLWFAPLQDGKKGKCRVGFWEAAFNFGRGGWRVATAGGFLVMPEGPEFWAGINGPLPGSL